MTPPGEDPVPFENPAVFLSDLNASVAANIVSSVADLALVIENGVVRDVAIGNTDLVEEGYDAAWRGKPWVDTVTAESRRKIEDMLKGTTTGPVRWRHVNHPSSSALDVPIKYTAIKIGPKDRYLALGRDLRPVSALQQKLVEAHQNLERDYTRLREAEARYRLLFESISEPVLIVDSASLQIEEANSAAARALGVHPAALNGRPLSDLVAPDHRRAVDVMAAQATSTGAARTPQLDLVAAGRAALHASAFREDAASRLIVRLARLQHADNGSEAASRRNLFETLQNLPDGLLVVNSDQRILAANGAFMEMTKIAGDTQAIGSDLSDFLGRSATDLNVLISTLRNHGVVRNFATILRDRFSAEEPVEVSAVKAPDKKGEVYGLSIRSVARRLPSGPGLGEQLPKSVDQLTELVGRVPLKDIVRDATVLIEKLCIEAALEITDHNRASAAEMLGLSRQGLYSKLKRSGIDSRS